MGIRSALAALAFALALTGCARHEQSSSAQSSALAAPASLGLLVGSPAPDFTYRLTGGTALRSRDLRGHPYIVWIMATWCSSCQGGTSAMAAHMAQLRARGVRLVQLEAAGDLGYPGPPLSTFQAAAGPAAASPNWYWGEATPVQMQVLDPHGYPDIYYLVNPAGRIVGIDGAPAATWQRIAAFAGV